MATRSLLFGVAALLQSFVFGHEESHPGAGGGRGVLTGKEEANQHSGDLVIVQGSPVSARKSKDLTYLTIYLNTIEIFLNKQIRLLVSGIDEGLQDVVDVFSRLSALLNHLEENVLDLLVSSVPLPDQKQVWD